MSKFDTSENKAICVLPFVHEFKHLNGKSGPCCVADTLKDGQTMQMVRDQMIQGQKPDACSVCYQNEDRSGWSERVSQTKDWLRKFGEPSVIDTNLEYIDLRFDSTCNLKCKTCGPRSSTLWQKEKGVSYPAVIDTMKYFESIDKSKLKKVYMAGGEPTYIPAYLEFLNDLHSVNPFCEVIVNTNLKSLPDAWKETMVKFKNLTVVCSCDATEDLGSYVRYPLEWKKFEQNVEWVSQNVNYLMFNLVASNITIHKIHETCGWMTRFTKAINLSILRGPEIFTIKAIPQHVRQTYISSVEQIRKHPINADFAARFRSEVKMILQHLNEDRHEPMLTKALKEELTEQDSHRHTKLADVDAFLHSWIYE